MFEILMRQTIISILSNCVSQVCIKVVKKSKLNSVLMLSNLRFNTLKLNSIKLKFNE